MLEETILSEEQCSSLTALLSAAERVVVTCHQGPDGDAVGSCSALLQLLLAMGKEAAVVVPNAFPDNLGFAPHAMEMVRFTEEPERATALLGNTQLIFSLDYNAPHRVGDQMAQALLAASAPRVMIDHHLDPDRDAYALTISEPQMSSTCEVLLHVIVEMGWAERLTSDVATALYLGMMTDTGAFTYASSRGEVFRSVALLLDRGIDKDHIYRSVFWGNSEARMRLMGYLLYVNMQLLPDCQASIITLSNAEYRRFRGVKNGDTEGIVNMPLQMKGVRLSIFMREDTEVAGKIRVSTRSVDDVPCNLICQEFFNGGGHKNASGGSLMCSLDEAVAVAKRAIEKYKEAIITK